MEHSWNEVRRWNTVGMKLEVETKWEVGTKSGKLEQKVESWNEKMEVATKS